MIGRCIGRRVLDNRFTRRPAVHVGRRHLFKLTKRVIKLGFGRPATDARWGQGVDLIRVFNQDWTTLRWSVMDIGEVTPRPGGLEE